VRIRYGNVAVNVGVGCISSRTRIFGDNSAFTPESRKTTENLGRFGRLQDLPDAYRLLASSPKFKCTDPFGWKRRLTWIVFKHSIRTAQQTLCNSVIQTSQLTLYREIITVCSQIHTKHINTLCGQNVELLNVKLVVHIVTIGLWRSMFTAPRTPLFLKIYSQTHNKNCVWTSVFKT